MTSYRVITRRLVLATGAALGMPHVARAADTLSVKLDFLPWGLHAAMHLANVNGWFKDAGLDVTVEDGRGSANTLQLVNAGQFDVGQIQTGLLPQAAANGARLKSFAGFGRGTDLAVIVGQDSGLNKVPDFRGKTLVCFAASPWAPFIDLWLKSGGLTRETATIMLVDPAALFGTYTAGRADALLSILGSALPVAQKARPSRALLASEGGIALPSYGLVATGHVLQSKKDALRRLVQVQQRVWGEFREGHLEDGVAATLKQRPDARLDPGILLEQLRLSLTTFDTPATAGKPLGWQAEADWAAGLATQLAAGIVKPGLKPEDFYTNEMIG